ncbi:secreted RxLR effector protein 161-like [Pistacia vera]|uniref:secreted RxLR effector protein 161-like n=1 Tax=Pistacia vera TaxID=55513 RepID=UPI001263546A|nr:secreted RxLR effector protein 161-like [Pistacia vera]
MKRIPYALAIGSIMYAMLCTRIDVSCALSTCSRYQSDPSKRYWMAVKNILKYLKRTKDTFLVYGGEDELTVRGYSDASFQADKDDYRSQSGFVFCLNGGTVSWKSSKQSTVADSTIEAEYIALSDAAKEACQAIVDNAARCAMGEKTTEETYELNMPAYAKFFKELNTHKRKYDRNEKVMISETEEIKDKLELALIAKDDELSDDEAREYRVDLDNEIRDMFDEELRMVIEHVNVKLVSSMESPPKLELKLYHRPLSMLT